MTKRVQPSPKNVNPHRAEIIALWHEFTTPKPTLSNFKAMCAEKGWTISYPSLQQWRARGMLPGESIGNRRNGSFLKLGSEVAGIAFRAQQDAKAAKEADTLYSKDMLRAIVAKSLRCTEAFVDRITSEALKLPITDMKELAIASSVAMDVMNHAVKVTQELQLLILSDAVAETTTATLVDLDGRREAMAKRLRGEG